VGARRRYQRVDTHSGGTATSAPSDTCGATANAAATVSTVVVVETTNSGTASRTVRASTSTSPVIRVSRSPEPALSTVDSGSATTRSRKSSRSSANTCSASVSDTTRDHRVSAVCNSTNAASVVARVSTWPRVVPRDTDSTSRPSSGGPASPATAAAAYRPSAPSSARGWRRSSSRAYARTSRAPATGSWTLTPRPG
jgi:hypothetical protein